MSTDTAQAGKLGDGVSRFARVLTVPAIKAPLSQALGDFGVRSAARTVAGLSVKSFSWVGAKAGMPTFEALFATRGQRAALAFGLEPEKALLSLLGPEAGSRLGDAREVTGLFAPGGEGVAIALYADLARLGFASEGGAHAPALLTLRREGKLAKVSFVASAAAVSSLFCVE